MLQNFIVIAFSIAEVLLEYSNYFAEVGREGEGIADTRGTVQLNKSCRYHVLIIDHNTPYRVLRLTSGYGASVRYWAYL